MIRAQEHPESGTLFSREGVASSAVGARRWSFLRKLRPVLLAQGFRLVWDRCAEFGRRPYSNLPGRWPERRHLENCIASTSSWILLNPSY